MPCTETFHTFISVISDCPTLCRQQLLLQLELFVVSPITQNTASFRVVEQQLVGVWVFIYCHYYLFEHISIIDVHRSMSVTDDVDIVFSRQHSYRRASRK